MSRRFRFMGIFSIFCILLSSCTTDSSTEASDDPCATVIVVEGSSTVEPVSTKAASLYSEECEGAQINVGKRGTGDGFQEFCAGKTDISDASRPIKSSEAEECKKSGVEYVELKIAFDGITVMTSLNNDASLSCLAFADLYALLGGESTGFEQWSDANELAEKLGSTVAPYPDDKFVVSAPGTESGTYDSFIEIVLEDVAEEQGQESFIRTDLGGQADDNLIIKGVEGSDTSLGWVGYSFAELNKDKVRLLEISEEPGGACVAPTLETIADQSYPISRDLFIYVSKEKMDSNSGLVPFVDFYLTTAYTEAVTKAQGESGYVPLPDELKAETMATWEEAKA